jgi:predicted dehydrogenase
MPVPKEDRLLRVGVLGCGPIAQAAHFESCTKARNATLHAICDVADDLRARMAATHAPARAYAEYDAMLADPELEAVIVATADAFHVEACARALEAGKHVLVEKPLATSIHEAETLRPILAGSGRRLQVGHMKRFDAGLEAARAFIDDGMGALVALKAWYCDSTHRYPMTDATQPLILTSETARRPTGNPKADLDRYYMLAHGSHLVDVARFFAGPLVAVHARLSRRGGMRAWFVDVEFESGALGHLDLTIAVRMDWHEGFHIYGEHGSIVGRTFNPWFYRSSEVDIFHEAEGASRRILGPDGHFYRRQLEGFADAILHDRPSLGATLEDGIASVRAMAAIAQSARTGLPVRLDAAEGPI